ncbi:flagellar hook-associated protein FlgL [Paraferrimonas sp. SM1919]|uniref:flagellar hook-associated protein FlgL n=1 Tax=Paraferrimonas sp. SM1919 TaxID=2662263 RepID=UPI0013CFA879|nr:flagellar hook-associated protein FlgL [Paraferrimonas sp. SM1919]
MRVSTNQLYYQNTNNISQSQNKVTQSLEQISSGKRVVTAGDDPVAMVAIDNLNHQNAQLDQYLSNIIYAQNRLASTEDLIQGAQDYIGMANERLLYANSGALSDLDKQAISNELDQIKQGLLELANSKDESGNYIFAGSQTDTIPFVDDGTGVIIYQGDDLNRQLNVADGVTVTTNVSGSDAFLSPINGGLDVFAAITRAQELMTTPGGIAQLDQAEYATLLDDLTGTMDALDVNRSKIGSQLQRLDYYQPAHQENQLLNARAIAPLQDIDFAQAISEFERQSLAMQAATQSFAKINSTTLFDYI